MAPSSTFPDLVFKFKKKQNLFAFNIFNFLIFKAVLTSEKLPSLEGVLVGGKSLQYSEYFLTHIFMSRNFVEIFQNFI